ncbi:MAG: LysR family transcriptional regulator substrate-binding protein [Proteobacteria bacterium]|nr:LysR family transcriptional regulator substrate-binding protein [Pseudomonadota bacterium]
MSTKVQIGLSPLIGVARAESILARFKSRSPTTERVYSETSIDKLYSRLARGLLDIIIVPNHPCGLAEADCVLLPLMSDQLMFVPRSSERAHWLGVEGVTVKDIVNEKFVLLPDTCGLTRAAIKLFQSQGFSLSRCEGQASCYNSILEWSDVSLASGILPISKVRNFQQRVIPILDGGHPVVIEYSIIGKPSTIPKNVFTELWDCLLEIKVALGQEGLGEERGRQAFCLQ